MIWVVLRLGCGFDDITSIQYFNKLSNVQHLSPNIEGISFLLLITGWFISVWPVILLKDCQRGGCECTRDVEGGDDGVEVFIDKELTVLCDATCDKGDFFLQRYDRIRLNFQTQDW